MTNDGETSFTTVPLYGASFDQSYQDPGDTTVKYGPIIAPGMIIMWYGSSSDIPDGWAICQQTFDTPTTYDGTNLIPDLTAKFVVGRGQSTTSPYSGPATPIGISGTVTTSSAGAHSHRFPDSWTSTVIEDQFSSSHKRSIIDDRNAYVDHSSTKTSNDGGHTHSISDWSGLTAEFSNAGGVQDPYSPPWFGLFFLIKLA